MNKTFDTIFKIGRVLNIICGFVLGLLFLTKLFALQDSTALVPTIVYGVALIIAVVCFIFAGKAYKKISSGEYTVKHCVILCVTGIASVFAYTVCGVLKIIDRDRTQIVSEPLVRLVKRDSSSVKRNVIVYAATITISLLLGCLLIAFVGNGDFFKVLTNVFTGSFSGGEIWVLLQNFALLLGVSAAIIPTFRMKFWNLGGNGQIMIGGVATMLVMHHLGKMGGLSQAVLIPIMIVAAVAAGMIWAVIPAIFKAYFKTNESLFTLMMNYVAVYIVEITIASMNPGGSGVLFARDYRNLGLIDVGNKYLLPIIVVAVITAFMIVYLKYSKHGYEISVVGESANTARYIGVNDKKVTIRTLLLSGAICGIIGLLIVGGKDHMVSTDSAGNMGFTAIMTVWLANCNPIAMIGTCFYVSFITKGMDAAATAIGVTDNSAINIVLGVVYFCIITCSFFINYKLVFRKSEVKPQTKATVSAADGGADNG